ncbi:MAG TPA: glycosyltransferase family 2 protein [Gaiellaceae bacterium]|jgi:glycosyltransferase involved in cell wall biosynthesis
MAPAVSFCIRGWRVDTAAMAIESVLSQTVDDVEVVITDDCGDLEPVARSFDDDRIRYFRNAEQLGPAWNARECLNRARGDLIGLLNDDDRLLPTFVEKVVERFEQVPRAGLVFTNHFFERNGKRWQRETLLPDGTYDKFLIRYLRTRPTAAGAMLMRRDVWLEGERAKPIPRETAADAFIALRAAAAGVTFSYIDEPLLVWRLHSGSVMASSAFGDLIVSLWSSFDFDGEAEALRLLQLRDAYMTRAAARLRSHQIAEARSDLDAARHLGSRARLLPLVARVPLLLAPALIANKWLYTMKRWLLRQA